MSLRTIATLLNDTFTISRKARTSDAQGGWVEAWTEVASAQGRLRPAGVVERTNARQDQAEVTHVLYVLAEANIRRDDRVAGAGITVQVVGVREPSRAGNHLEVDCQEVQRGR